MSDVPREGCFASCPRGLEDVLAEELREIGVFHVRVTSGGVAFSASWAEVRRVNLSSRIASRVLVRVAQGRYRSEDDIYRLAHKHDWPSRFGVDSTIRVDVTSGSGRDRSPLRSLEFATLRIKDGVCDRFRDASGERPSVDTREPDVRIAGYLDATICTLYLDTSGDALFKRGWRTEAGEAPLRENLAAGILRIAGWKPGTPLLDPMCGSGTFVVEAAQTALGILPGAQRRFGFERLTGFDAAAWESEKAAAQAAASVADPTALDALRASDVSGDAVAMTRANLERAGVAADAAHAIAPKQVDARQVKPNADSGILVTNPPYGSRIGLRGEAPTVANDEGDAFFVEFGNALKQRFAGWTAHVLTSDLQLQRSLRLAPDRRVVLFNGAIECRLFRFGLVSGSHR